MTYSHTLSASFTRTHARHLASKVIADLYQFSLFYGLPKEERISDYQEELIELLSNGYLSLYEFGFKKNDKRIISCRYTINFYGDLDDSSGNLESGVNISGANYYNFVDYSDAWISLSSGERVAFEQNLPFQRSDGNLPGDGGGYWEVDKSYSAGGTSLNRKTFRPLV